MYLPALPALAEDFAADAGQVQLTLSVFMAGMAGGQLLYGPVSDRFGRKLPLLAGALLFVAASFGCALAPGLDALRSEETTSELQSRMRISYAVFCSTKKNTSKTD